MFKVDNDAPTDTARETVGAPSTVDILATDKLGRLSCTIGGCKERDRFVLQTCKDHNIPVQISMGGGYSPAIELIIEAHANTYKMVQEVYF